MRQIIALCLLACLASIYASQEEFLRVSSPLLGMPYEFDPLGDLIEGSHRQPGSHKRPILQERSTDCVVFVEYVLSHLLAKTPEEAIKIQHALRYKQAPYHWFNRNHFSETEWLKATKAYLTSYAPLDKTALITQLHRAAAWWTHKKTQALAMGTLTPEQHQSFENNIRATYPQTVTLRYWPWSSVFSGDGELRKDFQPLGKSGWAVVLMVRKNWPESPLAPTQLLISHMGFIWDNQGTFTLRHASFKNAVLDIPIKDYFKDKIHLPSWEGIIILHPKESKSIQASSACRP